MITKTTQSTQLNQFVFCIYIYIYIYIYIKYIIYIFDLFIILSIASRNSFLVYNRQNYIPKFTSTTQI